jgi:outer membrane protein assembly factor BamB
VKLFSSISLIVALGLGLAGCSSSDEENIVVAELTDIDAKFEAKVQWQKQVGNGVSGHFSRLTPVLNRDTIYAASREGIVSAFDFASGEKKWSVDIRKSDTDYFSALFSEQESGRVSGGLTVAYGKLYLGTENGEVIALDIADGKTLWRKQVKGEVIAPPASGEGLIIVNTGAGYLVALHPDSGEMRWEYEQEVPPLTLRGISTPVVENGGVIFGSANGKLNVVIAQSGVEAWKQ